MEHKIYDVNMVFEHTAKALHYSSRFKSIAQTEAMLLSDKKKNQELNTAERIRLDKFNMYDASLDEFSKNFGDWNVILVGFFEGNVELDTKSLSIAEFKEFHVSLQELIEVMSKLSYEFLYQDYMFDAVNNDDLYQDFEESVAFINKMAHKIIYALLVGREFVLQSGQSYKVETIKKKFASRETLRYVNLDGKGELNCSTKAFVAMIRNEVETELTPEQISSMIDLALDTRDFDWVNKLVEQKNKLTQSS